MDELLTYKDSIDKRGVGLTAKVSVHRVEDCKFGLIVPHCITCIRQGQRSLCVNGLLFSIPFFFCLFWVLILRTRALEGKKG